MSSIQKSISENSSPLTLLKSVGLDKSRNARSRSNSMSKSPSSTPLNTRSRSNSLSANDTKLIEVASTAIASYQGEMFKQSANKLSESESESEADFESPKVAPVKSNITNKGLGSLLDTLSKSGMNNPEITAAQKRVDAAVASKGIIPPKHSSPPKSPPKVVTKKTLPIFLNNTSSSSEDLVTKPVAKKPVAKKPVASSSSSSSSEDVPKSTPLKPSNSSGMTFAQRMAAAKSKKNTSSPMKSTIPMKSTETPGKKPAPKVPLETPTKPAVKKPVVKKPIVLADSSDSNSEKTQDDTSDSEEVSMFKKKPAVVKKKPAVVRKSNKGKEYENSSDDSSEETKVTKQLKTTPVAKPTPGLNRTKLQDTRQGIVKAIATYDMDSSE